MYLVLIETSGNQNYIFASNKLKENIGASELTYRSGTSWVVEAVDRVRGASEAINEVGTQFITEAIEEARGQASISTEELRRKLLDDQEWNRPIDSYNDVQVETLIATSGKALLLTKDDKIAKAIIRYVTYKALRDAPGLDICGVISEKFDWGNGLSEAIRQVHKKFESVRSGKPSLALRFLRLPVVDECATSGLPAAKLDKRVSGKPAPCSAVSQSKRDFSKAGFKRIELLLKVRYSKVDFARSIRALDKEFFVEDNSNSQRIKQLDWLAVIHADGNGLGEIFLNFDQHIRNLEPTNQEDSSEDRSYADRLRKFSIALDICTEKAFLSALKVFIDGNKTGLIPIVPLILGGDDLSVVCDGKSALQFTHSFLTAFERETASNQHYVDDRHVEIIPKIANAALTVARLSACAGVAIIKPHFPFSVAYELAESLAQSAKQVKKIVKTNQKKDSKPYPCSALDFHVLYDTSGVALKKIRAKLEVDEGKTKLYSRPYVVTSENELQGAEGRNWVNLHKWESFQDRVRALKETADDGNRLLPSSQMHDLREGLFLGREVADARFRLIRDRYVQEGISRFEGEPNSLFQQETNSEIYITGLLDAIEAKDFMHE